MALEFLATTDIGIEEIAGREAEALIGCRAVPDVGKILFTAPPEAAYTLNLGARTINRVLILLRRADFERLDDLYELARDVEYTPFIDGDQSFAVRSERAGVHGFTSIDVSRVVGQAIIDSYRAATGARLRVDLDEPDVEVYCLVRGKEFFLAIDTTGRSLHRRGYRVYDHPAALKPTIASAMLAMAGWKAADALIDPMCGGGTIPIEAALMGRRIAPNRHRGDFNLLRLRIFDEECLQAERERLIDGERGGRLDIYGMERFRHHLEGARQNASDAGVLEAIHLSRGDATEASSYPDVPFDAVVVNPPYGIRMTPACPVSRLYHRFLEALKEVAEGAVLVLITAASRRFRDATETAETPIISERRVLHGGLSTRIFKCRI